MEFWPRDVMDRMSNEEDKLFLQNMMTDRSGSMVGTYKKLSIAGERIAYRKQQEIKRIEKEKQRLEAEQLNSYCIISDDEGKDEDEEVTPSSSKATDKVSHRRLRKTGVDVHIPYDILQSEQLVSTAVRNNITPTALSATIHSLVNACQGDPSKVNLSSRQSLRYRTYAVHSIAERIKREWQPPHPASLHWDGKLMETLTDKYVKDDRLPVLLSGIEGVKLLGVPSLPVKSPEKAGDLIAAATIGLLDDWNCKENIAAMVFDTTASNTGHLTAGCICIQEKLGKALLWCACRKHIGEVILTRVWDSLDLEVSKSKDITLFVTFRQSFSKLHYENSDLMYERSSNSYLINQRMSGIELLRNLKDCEIDEGSDHCKVNQGDLPLPAARVGAAVTMILFLLSNKC